MSFQVHFLHKCVYGTMLFKKGGGRRRKKRRRERGGGGGRGGGREQEEISKVDMQTLTWN